MYKYICFTSRGKDLAISIKKSLMDEENNICECMQGGNNKKSLSEWTLENFKTGNVLVFIGAIGIAVRAIAPFVKDKTTDPAVIVIDERGSFVIPLLSGHIGGAVDCAKKIASSINAIPVITTATDINNLFSVDVYAKKNNLVINDMKKAKEYSASLLRQNYAGKEVSNDKDFEISYKNYDGEKLWLIPRCIVIGMGCRKGKNASDLYKFAVKSLEEEKISPKAVLAIVSIDVKKNEPGLIELAGLFNSSFKTFSCGELSAVEGDFSGSSFVQGVVGIDNVCERSVMAYGCSKLLIRKKSFDGMTFAAGMIEDYKEKAHG